jgi:hypothetical protein
MGLIIKNDLWKVCFTIYFSGLMIATSLAITPTVKGTLPSSVAECSGMAYTGGSSFWTHNDGYGDENLYKVSNTGTLSRTVEVLGAVNHDWEDLAQDKDRNYLFIGDFGNNDCDRQNLRIYRIPHPSNISASTVTAEVINFSYPDQTRWPSPWMNFDVEGFFHFNGKLYLFTKPDLDAIGYTKMYRVPDQPGTHVATLVDSFYTNDRPTSADISPDGTSMIIMANSRIHLFRNFVGDDFFSGQYTKISISGGWTQKEGISFWSNNEIYLSDEDNGSGAKLYYIDMSPWIPAAVTTGIKSAERASDVIALPNPANSFFNVQFTNPVLTSCELKLFDLTGKEVRNVKADAGTSVLHMETSAITAGIYFYKLYADNREIRTERLVITH